MVIKHAAATYLEANVRTESSAVGGEDDLHVLLLLEGGIDA